MLLREFPDHTRPGFDLDAPCPVYRWPNMIIHARGSGVEYPEHLGPLSIKCAFGGRETYESDGHRYVVSDASYLILNDGQRYSSQIEADRNVEAFCIFFRPTFAHEALAATLSTSEQLLNDPAMRHGGPLTFFSRTYPHDDILSPLLYRIRRTASYLPLTRGWMEEQFHIMIECLFMIHRRTAEEIAKLPAVKSTTRAEIYRRLYHARDFIEANLGAPLDLPTIASAACFSTHHFLRLFKHAFHETPHQYLTRRRLERARDLLTFTDFSITKICTEIGFESLGSFSWLFRRYHGISPNSYRQKVRGMGGQTEREPVETHAPVKKIDGA